VSVVVDDDIEKVVFLLVLLFLLFP
jgi:hypothetical protein